jgi:hypothetical protein
MAEVKVVLMSYLRAEGATNVYCFDRLTEPKLGPEHENRVDTAVIRLVVTTGLVSVKPRADVPGPNPVAQGGCGWTDSDIK